MWETPIERNSGPGLESEKARGNEASVERLLHLLRRRSEVVPSAVFEDGTESEDALGKEFREAVDGENFEWLNENLERWEKRKDLLDDVITKGADVTVSFIQNVKCCKKPCICCTLR